MMPVAAVATIRMSKTDCTLGGGKCACCSAVPFKRIWPLKMKMPQSACKVREGCSLSLHAHVFRYKVPAGTGMWVPIMVIQNSKANWGEDADVYRPERWLEPNADYLPSTVDEGSKKQASGGGADASRQGGPLGGAVNGTHGSKSRGYELNVSRTQV